MKKLISILLALLMVTGTLAGCGKEPAAETTAASTAVETTAEETTAAPILTDEQVLALSASAFLDYVSNIDSQSANYDKIDLMTARQFLNYIKTKRVDDIAYFAGGRYTTPDSDSKVFTNKAFMVFNDIDVDSYEIISSDYDEFIVILRISKSNSALFPVGTSRWILTIHSYRDVWIATPIVLFRNAKDTAADISQSLMSYFLDVIGFCYKVSANLGCFETMDDFNKLVTNAIAGDNFEWFYDAFVNLLLQNRDGYYAENAFPVKRTELESLAKKAFGITSIDFKKCLEYNSTDDSIGSSSQVKSVYCAALSSSTYDQSTRIHTIVLDFYSDGAYLLKAKTMKYTLRENKDGSLTLLSTRLVYDSGYRMYSDTVSQ